MEDLETAVLEARTIAKKIRELIGTRIPNDDKKKGAPSDRALEYGDIAILMRSLPESLAVSAALAENGIPCYAQVTNGYFDATEVLLVLQCLSLIDNAAQDIPLAAVMLSRSAAFSPTNSPFFAHDTRRSPSIRSYGQPQ